MLTSYCVSGILENGWRIYMLAQEGGLIMSLKERL